jgi:DDE superfamily endonuclease
MHCGFAREAVKAAELTRQLRPGTPRGPESRSGRRGAAAGDSREWEAKLTPARAEDLRRQRKGKVGRSWYVDETYIRVHGQWKYLYRAIDRDGALVDVMLSDHRDLAAAKAVTGVAPDRITTDGHDAYPPAIRTVLGRGYGIGPTAS